MQAHPFSVQNFFYLAKLLEVPTPFPQVVVE